MAKYIVALQLGGLVEDPEIRYENAEVIEATSEENARAIYNIKHNCEFFYGHVLGRINGATIYLYADNGFDLSSPYVDDLRDTLCAQYNYKKMCIVMIGHPSSENPQVNFTGPAKYIIGYSRLDNPSSYLSSNEIKVDISDIDIIEGKNMEEAKQKYIDKYGYYKSRVNCIGEIRGFQVYLYKNKIIRLKNVEFAAENMYDLMVSNFDVMICDFPQQ